MADVLARQAHNASSDPHPPDKLCLVMADGVLKDRYQVGRFPLAHNGMGEVWPAVDKVLNRPVVVKVLPLTSDTRLVRRFTREALLTARLTHPGVPRVFDFGTHRGQPYLILEKIDGINLDDLSAEQGPLPIPWVASIGAQIAAVLLAAAEIGLVHRDIKPSNAMLEPSGAVKVLDFGLATVQRDPWYSRITETGDTLGTFGYMAPEQVEARPIDHRTDLYGLGATLYHLLTGEPPFDGSTTMATVRQQFKSEPPRPSILRPDIPVALDNVVRDLLAFDPADRPASAGDIHAALLPYVAVRPPIPGVVGNGGHPLLAYAAAITGVDGPIPASTTVAIPAQASSSAERAEALLAAGQFRAAARLWRKLADEYAQRHGGDEPQVFQWRLRAARAHKLMGEFDRALRLLEALLSQCIRALGPDNETAHEIRREIALIREAETQPAPVSVRKTPTSDR